MKRTGGEIVSSFFLQIDIRADDVIDIDTVLQPLQKIIAQPHHNSSFL